MSVPASAQSLPRLSLFLLAALSLFWGVNWPIMKIALGEVSPLIFRTLCVGSGAVGLLLLARLSGRSLALPKRYLAPVALAAFFNITCWNLLIAFGIGMMPAGRAAILAFTMPFWGILLGTLVLRERLTLRNGFGLVLGLGGMAVLMGGDLGVLGTAPLGALLVVGAAIAWACGTVVVKRTQPNIPTATLAGWQMVIGGVPILLGALLLERDEIAPVSLEATLAVLYNMIICFNFCYWAWFKIVRMVPVAVAGMGTLSIPVIGVFSSALLLGEPVGPQEFVSLALVVAALAAVLTRAPGAPGPARG